DVLEEGAVALWIASEEPVRVVMRHGWQPIGVPLLVTRSQGTIIEELGGRPAAVAYEEQLGVAPGELTPDNFWGTSILHPFGLLQADGSTIIRVARAKLDNGHLRIQGCVPPAGSAVHVMSGDADSLLAVVPEVAPAALAERQDAGVVLVFSCAARATIYGDRTVEEPKLLQEGAGAVPTFGFYCCGEFARTVGVLGTHNATITAVAL
ncbi:MAG TPA: FIST C-terminal domain-containing protein, partial [Longimicrobiales bacterium]